MTAFLYIINIRSIGTVQEWARTMSSHYRRLERLRPQPVDQSAFAVFVSASADYDPFQITSTNRHTAHDTRA